MRFADTSRGRPYAKDPAVVRYNNRYFLYYSLPPYHDGRAQDGWRIGIATSDDLDVWHAIGELVPEHAYEQNGIAAPDVIVLHDRVHLFYQTYGNGPRDAICHATSNDGITFTRNSSNPIFAPQGAWNNGRAIDADVVVYGDHLLLFFATRDPSGTTQMLGLAQAPLDTQFGRDSWTQVGDSPILAPELVWEQDCIEAPAACVRGSSIILFYAGAYNNRPQQIGCAASDDGIHWRRLSDQPFLPNGAPGSWNASESGHPFIFADADGTTSLFFQGNNDNGATWYLSRLVIGWHGNQPYIIAPE